MKIYFVPSTVVAPDARAAMASRVDPRHMRTILIQPAIPICCFYTINNP